jgi:hypothetical protein
MLFLFMNMQNICLSCACLSWYVFSVMIGALISIFLYLYLFMTSKSSYEPLHTDICIFSTLYQLSSHDAILIFYMIATILLKVALNTINQTFYMNTRLFLFCLLVRQSHINMENTNLV